MRTQFTITVDLDPAIVELDARRRGRPVAQAFTEIVGDLECRLVDAVRWRDGVIRVGSEIHAASQRLRPTNDAELPDLESSQLM